MGRSRVVTRGPDPPPTLKHHKNIVFLCNTGPDPLKNHKATKPAFNVGPASARQKKRYQIWTPSNKTFWIRDCISYFSMLPRGGGEKI